MSETKSTDRSFAVTHAHVIGIAWPMTLAFLTTPILGLVDTGVVGQMGSPALLGGLAVGAILFDIIFTTFNFLRASTTALVAQAMGAKDDRTEGVVLVRSLIISVVGGVIVLFFSHAVMSAGLWAMDVPDRVAEATIAYFSIRILAAPLTLINYTVLGWMLGLGRSGLGLLLQTLLNGVNIVLSLWLGLALGWGIEGVAWATVVAELVAVVAGLTIAWRMVLRSHPWNWAHIFDRNDLLRLLAVNRDIMVRSFALLFAFAFFTAQGAKYGETTLAANAVLMNMFLISGYFLDGFATAAEQLVGRAVGAHYRPAFDRAVRLTLFWGLVLALFATVVFLATGPWMIDTLSTDPGVRSEARTYLIWAALTALAGFVAFQMDGVFIGATWSADMRNMMLISILAYLLTWWIATPLMGNHGLWLALEVFLGMRGITMLARLPSKARQTFSI